MDKERILMQKLDENVMLNNYHNCHTYTSLSTFKVFSENLKTDLQKIIIKKLKKWAKDNNAFVGMTLFHHTIYLFKRDGLNGLYWQTGKFESKITKSNFKTISAVLTQQCMSHNIFKHLNQEDNKYVLFATPSIDSEQLLRSARNRKMLLSNSYTYASLSSFKVLSDTVIKDLKKIIIKKLKKWRKKDHNARRFMSSRTNTIYLCKRNRSSTLYWHLGVCHSKIRKRDFNKIAKTLIQQFKSHISFKDLLWDINNYIIYAIPDIAIKK